MPTGRRFTWLPLALSTLLEEEAGVFDFQLLQRDARSIAVRVGADGGGAPQDARLAVQRCSKALRELPARRLRRPAHRRGARRRWCADTAAGQASDRVDGRLRPIGPGRARACRLSPFARRGQCAALSPSTLSLAGRARLQALALSAGSGVRRDIPRSRLSPTPPEPRPSPASAWPAAPPPRCRCRAPCS